jgi:hypothetical protein
VCIYRDITQPEGVANICLEHKDMHIDGLCSIYMMTVFILPNSPFTLGRMFSEYESWCSGSKRTVFGKHSVYSRSTLAVRFRTDACGTALGSSKNVLRMFKIICIDLPNVACMCIREVFGKHSKNIRRVRKTFGKYASSSWCIRNEHFEVLGSVSFPVFSFMPPNV